MGERREMEEGKTEEEIVGSSDSRRKNARRNGLE
jgi:hypothetical protein